MINTPIKRVILTGGAGFVGANLVRHMLGAGYRVLNLDKLTYAGNLNSLADCKDHPNYSFRQIDLCDVDAVATAFADFQPSAVMHLAAESHVDRSIDSPDTFIRTNVLGTFQLLHQSRIYWSSLPTEEKSCFRFLHVSTDEVYGSLGDDGLFREDSRYDPHSPYSASKASSDHLVRAWFTTYNLPVLITNCSNNYGPYQFPEKLIPLVILRATRGETIPVYGQGLNVRDWLHVSDHCSALQTVLEQGACGESYNIGGNNERKNIEVVQTLCDILDRTHPAKNGESYKSLIRFVQDRPGHDFRYAIDSSKIQSELDWKPQLSFSSGLQQTVAWYLNNRIWWESILNGSYRMDRLGVVGG